MSDKPILQIRMLGGCSLTYGEKTISDANYHLKKPWMLLAYLITFRSQEIPIGELINLLYPGEEGSRPTGALKTLVYRVREILEELGIPDSREMILVTRGSYAWNAGVPVQLDTDLFELACQRSGSAWLSPEERLELCMSALALYRGDFLTKAAGERWVNQLIPCYHSMYVRLVQTAAGLLAEQERWEEVIQICGRAIQIDGYEEKFYYYLIRGLIRTGQTQQALERYKRAAFVGDDRTLSGDRAGAPGRGRSRPQGGGLGRHQQLPAAGGPADGRVFLRAGGIHGHLQSGGPLRRPVRPQGVSGHGVGLHAGRHRPAAADAEQLYGEAVRLHPEYPASGGRGGPIQRVPVYSAAAGPLRGKGTGGPAPHYQPVYGKLPPVSAASADEHPGDRRRSIVDGRKGESSWN